MTFTSVYIEKTVEDAHNRLEALRKNSRRKEVKAYILPTEDGQYRVARKVEFPDVKKKGQK